MTRLEASAAKDRANPRRWPPTFWERVLRLTLLVAALSGFLRIYGALSEREALPLFGLQVWQPIYLAGAGLLIGGLNLLAWLALHLHWRWHRAWAWAAVLVTIAQYWGERLFLWSPDQRGGNTLFVIGLHGLWIALCLSYADLERKREKNSYGSGN